MNKKRLSLMAIALFALLCIPFSAFAQSAKPAKVAAEINATDATILWEMHDQDKSPTQATVSVPEAISSTSYAVGANLYLKGAASGTNDDGSTCVLSKVNVYENASNSGSDAYATSTITWSIIPKKGVSITPKKFNFNAQKCGTGGGTMDIVAIVGDKTYEIAKDFNPERNNKFTAAEFDLSALGTVTEKVEIVTYIFNLATNKQLAIGDVKVTADFKGKPEAVPVYTMTAKASIEGAGNITVNPAGAEFDEGTELTVSATENFGYHFSAWTDEAGNVISEANPYTFAIKANTALIAQYTQKNVYALNMTINGGANDYNVQFAPEGNIIDGVHWYEEGTDVKLSVLNNRILTFTNWEDNSTEQERVITMDGEKNLTANFSCEDYIVAWDFYHKEPGVARAADYRVDSENAGLLVLRKEDGSTSSWLGQGTDTGNPYLEGNARPWKQREEKYYFEFSFNTLGYTDISIETKMGKDYASYSRFILQYSVDGTNYVDFGEVGVPDKSWYEATAKLPAAAENQKTLYVRFYPDFNSEITGNETTLDGVKLGPTWFLASLNAADDTEAPKLVNSIPANGSKGASANGSVILNFNERIVAVNGAKATLNGKELTPNVTGKSLIFPYTRLDYNTEYTFVLPAGAVTDRTGNKFEGAEIKFTTMDRKQPTARVYDAVIAADGSGDYTTVQAAIDAAPAQRGTPWLIFVKEGLYFEHINIPASKPYLYFIGQDRDKVKFSHDRLCGGENAYSTSDGASVVVNSANCFFENISFINAYGHEKQSGPQALALNTQGDRIVFNNCAMYSYQDTWITTSTGNNRCYAKNCFIEGAVDYIYNSGNYYFDHCTHWINRTNGGYIVAPSHTLDVKWGYVFMNNTITAPGTPSETSVWLGRPWHNNPKTVWINTIAEVTIPAEGWYETMGGLPYLWAEYNTMNAKGEPLDLSKRRTKYYKTVDGEKVWGESQTAVLTAEQAAQYTIENVLGGDDNWQPEVMCEACNAPKPLINGGKMTWDAVPYAICYVITKDGKVVGFTTETSYDVEDGAKYSVQAANEFGGLSEATEATSGTGIANVETADKAEVIAIYSIDGKRLNKVQAGQVNIVKYNDGTVVKVTK